MSAILCNDRTIALVALWACAPEDGTSQAFKMACTVLFEENRASTHAVYEIHNDAHLSFNMPPAHTLAGLALIPAQRSLGAIRCYVYQADQTPNWPHTLACHLATLAEQNTRNAGATGSGDGWSL